MEDEKVDPKYLKGFNGGYTLPAAEVKRFEHEVDNFDKNSSFCRGMMAGQRQRDKENFLQQHRPEKQKSKDHER